MEDFVAVIGTLLFVFLVLSAAVESVLEAFRGVLEAFGITFLKGKVSLEDALKLSGEFAAGDAALQAKVEAVKTVANQLTRAGQTIVDATTINDLKKLSFAAPAAPGAPPAANVADVAELSRLAAKVKSAVDESEGRRILLLRILSVIIGCIITGLSGIQILAIVAAADPKHTADLVQTLGASGAQIVNILIGGLAASVGSSYWHDQLDRVRKVKDVSKQLSAIVK